VMQHPPTEIHSLTVPDNRHVGRHVGSSMNRSTAQLMVNTWPAYASNKCRSSRTCERHGFWPVLDKTASAGADVGEVLIVVQCLSAGCNPSNT